jgi:hypothetical protein
MPDTDPILPLAAYRPDGSDAADPVMAAALEALRSDPAAAADFEAQRQFDLEVAKALAELPVPPDLRGSLIAGAELARAAAGGAPRPSRPVPAWAGAAAAVLVLAVAAGAVYLASRPDGAGSATASAPANPAPKGTDHPAPLPAPGPGFLVPVVPVNSVQRTIAVLDQAMGGHVGDDASRDLDVGELPEWLNRHFGTGVLVPAGLEGRPVRLCSFFRDAGGGIALLCYDVGGPTKLHLTISKFDGADRLPESASKCGIGRCRQWEFVAWHHGDKQYVLVADASDPQCCRWLREIAGA